MVATQILEPDILIVVSGISGAALACAIRGRGYDVVLVERSPQPPDTAREFHFSEQKQANTQLLEVNHERAKEDVGTLRTYLRKVAADTRMTARYIWEPTGYPHESDSP